MTIVTKSPAAAKALLDGPEGWIYLDVRAQDEFRSAHPAGAWNVPVMLRSPLGMEINPEFPEIVQKHFAKDARLVVGCAMGGRSMKACQLLLEIGYRHVVNVGGGFSGMRDGQGRVIAPGWQGAGLPCDSGDPAGRCYEVLRAG